MSEEQKLAAARMDKDFAPETGGKGRAKRRRKVSYLTINKIESVDYKDVPILRRYINDRGKMLPARQTGNTAKQQRMVARAIRRARELALLPFVVTEMTAERREFTPRRSYGDRPQRDYNNHEAPAAPAERAEKAEKQEAPAAAAE